MSDGLLLDTCAVIWWVEGATIRAEARKAIDNSSRTFGIRVSAITAWELALVQFQGRKPAIASVRRWYAEVLALDGFAEQPLTAEILVGAWQLPLPLHRDPADRIFIATARAHNLTLVTRDRAILAYGEAGHVRVLAC